MKEKTKFALYLDPTLKADLEERFREDGSRSQTEFAEKALRFYLDYLNAENGGNYLPLAIRSCIEGRLGLFEDRIARLLFKMAVEHDMSLGVLVDSFELPEEYLRKKRGESIGNIKRTSGRLTFEEIAQEDAETWQD